MGRKRKGTKNRFKELRVNKNCVVYLRACGHSGLSTGCDCDSTGKLQSKPYDGADRWINEKCLFRKREVGWLTMKEEVEAASHFVRISTSLVFFFFVRP